jgi:hypothetical protein
MTCENMVFNKEIPQPRPLYVSPIKMPGGKVTHVFSRLGRKFTF